jgi:hypothetical protein
MFILADQLEALVLIFYPFSFVVLFNGKSNDMYCVLLQDIYFGIVE